VPNDQFQDGEIGDQVGLGISTRENPLVDWSGPAIAAWRAGRLLVDGPNGRLCNNEFSVSGKVADQEGTQWLSVWGHLLRTVYQRHATMNPENHPPHGTRIAFDVTNNPAPASGAQ